MKRIAVLGATGSIGRSTLAVARRHPDRFQIVALSALSSVEELESVASEFGVSEVAVADAAPPSASAPRWPVGAGTPAPRVSRSSRGCRRSISWSMR